MQVTKVKFEKDKNKITVSGAVVNNKPKPTSEKIITNISLVLLEMFGKNQIESEVEKIE